MAFPSICMALWMLLASMVMASIEAGPQDPTIHMWRDEGSVLRWSEEFEKRALAAIRENQFPTHCSDKKVLFITNGHADRGMFAELHTFVGAMMQGVVINRTVIQDPLPPLAVKLTLEFEGCESRNLHCYYEPIWGGPCVETFKKERKASRSAVQMNIIETHDKVAVLRDCLNPKVDDHHKLRWLRDIAGHDLPANLTVKDTDFILMAFGMGFLRPRASIMEGVKRFPMVPTLMAHARRTDKKKEMSVRYDNGSSYLPTSIFANCLASINARFPHVGYQRVHFMSDDDTAYAEMKAYIETAGGRVGASRRLGKQHFRPIVLQSFERVMCYDQPCVQYSMANLANITMTQYSNAFEELLDDKALKHFHQGGHSAIPVSYGKRFHDLLLVDVYSAVMAPEIRACVTMSSNVGRFIMGYAGFKHRAVQLGISGELGVSLDRDWIRAYCPH